MPTVDNTIDITICMLAYNAAPWIREAIDSVLAQQTTYTYTLLIADDASTDETPAIIREYAGRFSDRITPIFRTHNLGNVTNFIKTLQSAAGRYVAILDADDYWTDSKKLQTQVDFLEAHPDYVLSCHDGHIYDQGILRPCRPPRVKPYYTVHDMLIDPDFFPLSFSVVLRNGYFGSWPDWYYGLYISDFPIYLLVGVRSQGKFQFIRKSMGVYRHRTGSISSSLSDQVRLENELAMIQVLRSNRLISPALTDRYFARYCGYYAGFLARHQQPAAALRYAVTALKSWVLSFFRPLLIWIRPVRR